MENNEHIKKIAELLTISPKQVNQVLDLTAEGNTIPFISQGRFLLGLGSQIKPHIEKRFSMPWSHPAPRMREFVLAMRAIWSAWHEGTKLAFRGDFYTHTLMTPFFDAGPNP